MCGAWKGDSPPARRSRLLTFGGWLWAPAPNTLSRGLIGHRGKQVFKYNMANLDVFLHWGHWPDAEPLGKLDSGLWGRGFVLTLDQLKHNPRVRKPQAEVVDMSSLAPRMLCFTGDKARPHRSQKGAGDLQAANSCATSLLISAPE